MPSTEAPSHTITPALPAQGDVRVYEFGCRLDKESVAAAVDQIFMARRLYNALIACERDIVGEMRAFVIEKAGPEAAAADERIERLNAAFAAARADNDEGEMRNVARERRAAWRELADLLKAARKEHRSEIQARFLNRIGKKATCDTYKLRCEAVSAGLGWATANATLDAALLAFKKSFTKGRAPRFAKGYEKDQDTLTLQFTNAGGVPASTLLNGGNGELAMFARNGCGRRRYDAFRFRLGAASAGVEATGTWQYHRPLPADASVGLARLIRRRIGTTYRWALQLMIKSPLVEAQGEGRKPLCAIHFGWAADVSGRRVAGIASEADPGSASILQLPTSIEEDIARANDVQGKRDASRDAIVAKIKAQTWPVASVDDLAAEEPKGEVSAARQASEDLTAIRKLPAQHVASRRLHHLCRLLRDAGWLPEWLDVWRKADKQHWTAAAHGARRARNRRRDFYRNVALQIAQSYQTIVIEPLDLASAAVVVDEKTGERSEFAKKARAGRTIAALYEFESALRWAATKCHTAVLELQGPTASQCSVCGSADVVADEEDSQATHCHGCGAALDRKANGAAIAWQAANDDLEALVEDYWAQAIAVKREAEEKRAARKHKMAEGRAKARAEGSARRLAASSLVIEATGEQE